MAGHERTLGREQARAFYDGFGRRQDRQAFYEDVALQGILAEGGFEEARNVAELGCGTGRFAEILLSERLPAGASYLGVDLSPTMVTLASTRLARFGERARVVLTDGEPRLPLPERVADRFVTNYVLDLLPLAEIDEVLAEAHRVLRPGGRLCATGLTEGSGPLSRLVSGLWRRVQRLSPRLVGGCRPVCVAERLDGAAWRPLHVATVVAWGIPSEVLVAERV
ncbi:MAG: class I SAM-dependent methyltransferase [Thermoanaerobaculia bacterium]